MNPFLNLKKRDYILWLVSVAAMIVCNVLNRPIDRMTLIASLVGVTSLIFAAKGNVWAQFLMIVFSILYGVISYRFSYYGEMITYLGMTLPMSVWSAITWLKNPSEQRGVVKIRKLSPGAFGGILILTVLVTVAFWRILSALHTPNLFFSTLSIATSFAAVFLTMLRSAYFPAAYALNDLVLIVLWILASKEDPKNIPVIFIFAVFFMNDLYGFISWKKRENENLSSEKGIGFPK